MRPSPAALAALAAVLAAALLLPPGAAAWRTRGAVDALPPACGAQLDALLADAYPDGATPAGKPAPNACGVTVREALKVNVTDRCPDSETLVACLNSAKDAWTAFVAKCELFAGVPLASAPDAGGARRRLMDEGEGEGEGEGGAASLAGQGCFPAFRTSADFGAWLDGRYAEPVNHGTASPAALASVAVFAAALLSMAAL